MSKESKPIASLSLDLDNKWSYMKTHGDSGWQSFPSYLDVLIPRVLDFLSERGLTITFFVVGQDAALAKNHEALAQLAREGHEIGNHSFHHEPWLHLHSEAEIEQELAEAEIQIQNATGQKVVGFRGPGFTFSPDILKVLKRRGYLYDASTLPTYLGPLARAYYFMSARLPEEEKERRKTLFGKWSDGKRPIKPYQLSVNGGTLTEIPVTTMPGFKTPIHLSYILYLGMFSQALALTYFRTALALCRASNVTPSILLHPLDFLGATDEKDLSFFPGMRMPTDKKLNIVALALDTLRSQFEVKTLRDHALAVAQERDNVVDGSSPT